MTNLFSGVCHIFGQQNQKYCPTTHLFWEFNNKSVLSHLDDVITLSYPIKFIIFANNKTTCPCGGQVFIFKIPHVSLIKHGKTKHLDKWNSPSPVPLEIFSN